MVDLIVHVSDPQEEYGKQKSQQSVAETIENNVRRVIIEESQTNPKYYEKMSKLLDEIIRQRKDETLAYQEYLKKIAELAESVSNPSKTSDYPSSLISSAKRALLRMERSIFLLMGLKAF